MRSLNHFERYSSLNSIVKLFDLFGLGNRFKWLLWCINHVYLFWVCFEKEDTSKKKKKKNHVGADHVFVLIQSWQKLKYIRSVFWSKRSRIQLNQLQLEWEFPWKEHTNYQQIIYNAVAFICIIHIYTSILCVFHEYNQLKITQKFNGYSVWQNQILHPK